MSVSCLTIMNNFQIIFLKSDDLKRFKMLRNIYFKMKSILTFTENITPPLGLNELNRASKSFAFSLSQSMLQTANRCVI